MVIRSSFCKKNEPRVFSRDKTFKSLSIEKKIQELPTWEDFTVGWS